MEQILEKYAGMHFALHHPLWSNELWKISLEIEASEIVGRLSVLVELLWNAGLRGKQTAVRQSQSFEILDLCTWLELDGPL